MNDRLVGAGGDPPLPVLYVRRATERDIAYIVELSARVQAALIASGSLQQIGSIPDEQVTEMVTGSYAHLLIEDGRPIGSVFVAPASEEITARFVLQPYAADDKPIWFLSKLMIEPPLQGRGLGNLLLDAAKDVTARSAGVLTLDCWAGNHKLRAFYTNAGFRLHGVFSVGDFDVAVFIWSDQSQSASVGSLPHSILPR